MTTLFLLLRVTRSSQCCLTDILRTTDLNSSSETNRWPTWSPEYISVMTAVDYTEQPGQVCGRTYRIPSVVHLDVVKAKRLLDGHTNCAEHCPHTARLSIGSLGACTFDQEKYTSRIWHHCDGIVIWHSTRKKSAGKPLFSPRSTSGVV
jgi:hypothetical protein